MQEKQVSVEGTTYALEPPFHVLATANPIEYEGTYPLPEAQLDRFLLRVSFGYPSHGRGVGRAAAADGPPPGGGRAARRWSTPARCSRMQAALEDVAVEDSVGRYIVALTAATREHPQVLVGASPRGSLALMLLARAVAALAGPRLRGARRTSRRWRSPALAHRITLRPEMWLRRVDSAHVVASVLAEVPAPASGALPRHSRPFRPGRRGDRSSRRRYAAAPTAPLRVPAAVLPGHRARRSSSELVRPVRAAARQRAIGPDAVPGSAGRTWLVLLAVLARPGRPGRARRAARPRRGLGAAASGPARCRGWSWPCRPIRWPRVATSRSALRVGNPNRGPLRPGVVRVQHSPLAAAARAATGRSRPRPVAAAGIDPGRPGPGAALRWGRHALGPAAAYAVACDGLLVSQPAVAAGGRPAGAPADRRRSGPTRRCPGPPAWSAATARAGPGEGGELAGVRRYGPGDRLRRVDWRVTLRTRRAARRRTPSPTGTPRWWCCSTCCTRPAARAASTARRLGAGHHGAGRRRDHRALPAPGRPGRDCWSTPATRATCGRPAAAGSCRPRWSGCSTHPGHRRRETTRRCSTWIRTSSPTRALVVVLTPLLDSQSAEMIATLARAGRVVVAVDTLGDLADRPVVGSQWTALAQRLWRLERENTIGAAAGARRAGDRLGRRRQPRPGAAGHDPAGRRARGSGSDDDDRPQWPVAARRVAIEPVDGGPPGQRRAGRWSALVAILAARRRAVLAAAADAVRRPAAGVRRRGRRSPAVAVGALPAHPVGRHVPAAAWSGCGWSPPSGTAVAGGLVRVGVLGRAALPHPRRGRARRRPAVRRRGAGPGAAPLGRPGRHRAGGRGGRRASAGWRWSAC